MKPDSTICFLLFLKCWLLIIFTGFRWWGEGGTHDACWQTELCTADLSARIKLIKAIPASEESIFLFVVIIVFINIEWWLIGATAVWVIWLDNLLRRQSQMPNFDSLDRGQGIGRRRAISQLCICGERGDERPFATHWHAINGCSLHVLSSTIKQHLSTYLYCDY